MCLYLRSMHAAHVKKKRCNKVEPLIPAARITKQSICLLVGESVGSVSHVGEHLLSMLCYAAPGSDREAAGAAGRQDQRIPWP